MFPPHGKVSVYVDHVIIPVLLIYKISIIQETEFLYYISPILLADKDVAFSAHKTMPSYVCRITLQNSQRIDNSFDVHIVDPSVARHFDSVIAKRALATYTVELLELQ